ncbi:MAG: hypothetical protein LBQ88_02805 [Treponema sp.]|jgi:hypothetical protein|nr:hypothetical protein [Treponema sp.]
MKIKTLLLFLLAFSGQSLFSASLEELTTPGNIGQLLNGSTVSEAQFKKPQPKLVPKSDFLQRRIAGIQEDLNPNIIVESLYLYKKPYDAEESAWTEIERANLYNATLALSTLSGIQYYSASRKTMRTFYEFSSVIDGPDKKKTLGDPVYPVPPAELTIYARQKDLTFGDNIYRYDYFAQDGCLVFVQQNLTGLNAGIIPAVGRNNLRSLVAVFDAGDSLLIYAASMAKSFSLPGLEERISQSFSNRAGAIFMWFTLQADKAFSK